MKFTSRERNLLVGLLVVLMVTGLYYFVYSPIIEAYNGATVENVSAHEEYDLIKNVVIDENLIVSMQERVGLLETLLPAAVHQEKVILEIKDIFDTYDILLQTMTFDNGSEKEEDEEDKQSFDDIIAGYEGASEYQSDAFSNFSTLVEKGEVKDEELKEDIIKYFTCNLSFETTYKNLKLILKQFEDMEQIVITDNLNISKNGLTENSLSITLDVKFPYSAEFASIRELKWFDKNTPKENYDPFDYETFSTIGTAGGVSNIFDTFTKNGTINSGETPNQNTTTKPAEVTSSSVQPDFDMGLLEFINDDATIKILKTDAGYTTLYQDTEIPAYIDIEVKKENDKYYYKYSNMYRSYPANDGYEEFKPVHTGEIVMRVYSTNRKNTADLSGAVLRVTNNTERSFVIHTFADDADKPRLVLTKVAGNAEVIKH